MKKLILISISLMLFCQSCNTTVSITQRYHQKGLHVEVTKKYQKVSLPETNAPEEAGVMLSAEKPGNALLVEPVVVPANIADEASSLITFPVSAYPAIPFLSERQDYTFEKHISEKYQLKNLRQVKTALKKSGIAKPVTEDMDIISILSMVFGILGFILLFVPALWAGLFALLFGIAAFVTGIIGLGRTLGDNKTHSGMGFAIAGLVLGSLVLLLFLFVIILIATVF